MNLQKDLISSVIFMAGEKRQLDLFLLCFLELSFLFSSATLVSSHSTPTFLINRFLETFAFMDEHEFSNCGSWVWVWG